VIAVMPLLKSQPVRLFLSEEGNKRARNQSCVFRHGQSVFQRAEFGILTVDFHPDQEGEQQMEWKKSLLALMLGSSVALAACGGGEEEDAADNTAVEDTETETETEAPATDEGTEETTASAGEEVYQQSCLSCHGGNLEGGFGPALDKIGAEYSKDEILDIIHNGKGQMPANVVEGEEAEAVASWLAEKK
jgi:cytochrome c551